MRDGNNRSQNQMSPVSALASPKRLGNHLVEAGLLTPAQVHVVLNDQQATGMRFGEIVVARGWLKEQTIEWVMEKVVVPQQQEQQVQEKAPEPLPAPTRLKLPPPPDPFQPIQPGQTDAASSAASSHPGDRRSPITKPLPSVQSGDGDVNWVG